MKTPARAVLLLPAFLALPCHAGSQPLWELGAGAATLSVPDYRGSAQRKTYYLPLPYFVYRGAFFKADRNGARAALFESERLQINLSVNASLPVSSSDNRLRRGMADLKPMVEVGPTAGVNLWKSSGGNMKLDFRAPLRAAITVESSPRQIGWLFAPGLNLDIRDPAGYGGWKLGVGAAPLFTSRGYNRYFYSVGADEATLARPAYSAPGGYAGLQLSSTLSKRFAHYWVGAFLRYDNLAGAVFADSPLVERRDALSAGVAVSWIFGASTIQVEAPE